MSRVGRNPSSLMLSCILSMFLFHLWVAFAPPAVCGVSGIWKSDDGSVNLYVQTYADESQLVIARMDSNYYVFLDDRESPGVVAPDYFGRNACTYLDFSSESDAHFLININGSELERDITRVYEQTCDSEAAGTDVSGIWKSSDQAVNLYIAAYTTGSALVIATMDGENFEVYLDPDLSDGIQADELFGKDGRLSIDFTDQDSAKAIISSMTPSEGVEVQRTFTSVCESFTQPSEDVCAMDHRHYTVAGIAMRYRQLLLSHSSLDAKQVILNELKSNPNIEDVELTWNGTGLIVTMDGLLYFLLYDQNLSNVDSTKEGTSNNVFQNDVSIQNESNLTFNNRAIIIAPFWYEFKKQSLSKIETYLTGCGYDVTLIKDNITLEDFKNLSDYGVIIIDSHGAVGRGQVVVDTGVPENASITSNTEYIVKRSFESSKLVLNCHESQSTGSTMCSYAMLPNWMNSYYHKSDDQNVFIYIDACYSMINRSFFSAMIGTNDHTSDGFGWDNSIRSDNASDTIIEMFKNLLPGGLTTAQSYEDLQQKNLDSYSYTEQDPQSTTTLVRYRETSPTLRLTNCLHSVAILSPENGASTVRGTNITFSGSAYTSDGVEFEAKTYQWVSDLDGVIGSEKTFSTDSLSTGTHAITLTASDACGNQNSTAVTLQILAPECEDISGTWYVSETVKFTCTAMGETESDTLTGSGSAYITQNGCSVSYSVPQFDVERTGSVKGNSVRFEGPFVVPLANDVNLSQNSATITGTISGNRIDATGSGIAKGSYMGYSFSCQGTSQATFTRSGYSAAAPDSGAEEFPASPLRIPFLKSMGIAAQHGSSK